MGNCEISQLEGARKDLEDLGFGWAILEKVQGNVGLLWIVCSQRQARFCDWVS